MICFWLIWSPRLHTSAFAAPAAAPGGSSGTIGEGANAMASLTIEVTDDLARSLEGIAAAQHKSIQELAIERLSSLVEGSPEHRAGSPAAVLRAMQAPPTPERFGC